MVPTYSFVLHLFFTNRISICISLSLANCFWRERECVGEKESVWSWSVCWCHLDIYIKLLHFEQSPPWHFKTVKPDILVFWNFAWSCNILPSNPSRGWGPAGNTGHGRSQLRSGGEHWPNGRAVEVESEHSACLLAVAVRTARRGSRLKDEDCDEGGRKEEEGGD